MKRVNALEVYELDYLAAQQAGKAVRLGPAASGGHTVCWMADTRVMYSPSTRWRQTSHFLLLMAREGKLTITGGETQRQLVVFEPYPAENIEPRPWVERFIGGHETSLSVALIRCFVLWKYGPEVPDVSV